MEPNSANGPSPVRSPCGRPAWPTTGMADDLFIIAVECDADPAGAPMPRSFCLGERTIEVVEILDRWPGADHLYLKLRGADGAFYILRQDLARDRWQLVLFDANRT